MKFKMILMLAVLMVSGWAVNAQDLIYKKNNEVIVSKIIEIGVDEIKYKEFANQDGLTLVIDKKEVTRIKFESGKTVIIMDNMTNPEHYANQRKNALKIDFLAPMFGQTTFGYERSLKPGESVEFQVGIVGLGTNNYKSDNLYSTSSVTSTGMFVRAGFKLIKSPDFYLKGMQYAHVLKGSYIKPEITFGGCTEELKYNPWYSSSSTAITTTKHVRFGALMINFGKQWVFNDIFLVDQFVGVGYGFSTKSNDNAGYSAPLTWQSNNHAFIGPYSSTPFAWAMGLKIGILIK